MTNTETTDDEEQCEERFCSDKAEVTLINNATGEERAYCFTHADEGLNKISSLNVGRTLNTGDET